MFFPAASWALSEQSFSFSFTGQPPLMSSNDPIWGLFYLRCRDLWAVCVAARHSRFIYSFFCVLPLWVKVLCRKPANLSERWVWWGRSAWSHTGRKAFQSEAKQGHLHQVANLQTTLSCSMICQHAFHYAQVSSHRGKEGGKQRHVRGERRSVICVVGL